MNQYDDELEDTTVYKVVINDEEQYSIWPEYRENPPGWTDVGKTGLEAECLAYINEVWTDMRPLSIKKQIQELAEDRSPIPTGPIQDRTPSLVERLSKGDHPVRLSLRPEESLTRFQEAIARNYVHVVFVGTSGGTELGFSLDRDACDLSKADFEKGIGVAHLEGDLSVDYVGARCIVEINLETFAGWGCLDAYGALEAVETPSGLVHDLSSQHFQLP